MTTPTKTIAAAAAAAVLAAGGAAVAADTATQISVEPVAAIEAGATAPFDAAGVKAIRRGKPIPKGYVLIGQKVTSTSGIKPAGASLSFRCPGEKRLKTFGGGPMAADRTYYNHRQTWIRTFAAPKGQTQTYTVYAVCR